MPAARGNWFPYRRPNPAARLRLFCIHHAGGAASFFRPWLNAFGPDVEVFPVQLPGRETRFGEPMFRRVEPSVTALADQMRPFLDRPYAIAGFSMGALIGYELVRLLERQGAPRPVGAVMLSLRPPDRVHLLARKLHAVPDEEFLQHVRQLNGVGPDAASDPGLAMLALTVLRTDLELYETYEYAKGPPVSTPITVIAGDHDPEVPLDEVERWREFASVVTGIHILPGGHFFLTDHPNEVQRLVAQALR